MENERWPTKRWPTNVKFLGIVEGASGIRRAHFERGEGDFFLLTEDALRERIADLKVRSVNTEPEEKALLALHKEPEAKQ